MCTEKQTKHLFAELDRIKSRLALIEEMFAGHKHIGEHKVWVPNKENKRCNVCEDTEYPTKTFTFQSYEYDMTFTQEICSNCREIIAKGSKK